MFLNKYLSLLPVVTEAMFNPVIKHQPTIKTCDIKTLTTQENIVKDEKLRDKIIELKFSFEYSIHTDDFMILIYHHFEFGGGKCHLKRFMKKSFLVKYEGKDSAPQTLTLPSTGKEYFRLNVINIFLDDNCEILEKGIVEISLYRENESDEETTISAINEAVMCLKDLLEITDGTNPNDFAYQFSVETTTNEEMKNGKASKIVYTNMFKVIFEDDGCGVKLEYVDPYYYYMC